LDWLYWTTLLALVAILWCFAYNRWTREAWNTPVSYTGDSWGEMAAAKAFATGEVHPILPKNPSSLGAPFVASWNDYPIVEEGIFTWYGLFVRLFGIFAGSNLVLLSAHLLAAGSFYFVCRQLRYERMISFAIAILFSMSVFAFARSLWHLVLTFYWHVPLGLLVVWWCISTNAYADKRKWIACVLISVLHGIQYVYYTGLFVQFLGLAALVCLLQRKSRAQILFPLLLIGVILATFVLMNVDTFYYRFANGPNTAALVRIYSGLELYALRPVELFLPEFHRFTALQEWANRAYYSQTTFQGGENNSLYLGIVAIAALVWLAVISVRAISLRVPAGVPSHAWAISWILAFSVIGGLNGMMGVFGLVLFRGTNRYSVVIFCLALLFLARQLTRAAVKWRSLPIFGCACFILVIGLWDQLPRFPSADEIDFVHRRVVSDGRIVSALESKLARRAMIFELPVAGYPEVGPIAGMLDYEHFRPYLQSHNLRFSYGTHKGRTRERWQAELMSFGTANAVASLEKYGFAALLINRKGYPDNAVSLLADLRSAGRSEILCESDELIVVALQPVKHPSLPPEFDEHWSGLEGTLADHWRWSMGDAKLILYNGDSAERTIHLSFNLFSLLKRKVDVLAGSKELFSVSLDPGQPSPSVDLVVSLRPGKNELLFRTDRPGELPGNGDPRKLAFSLRNFEFRD
jgi:phosphoglycerol transferase